MFFNVSETNAAQESVEKAIGPAGRMIETPQHANISLWSKFLGKFWYGDLDAAAVNKLKDVAKELKETIYVIPEWQEGMYADGRPFSDAAVTEISA